MPLRAAGALSLLSVLVTVFRARWSIYPHAESNDRVFGGQREWTLTDFLLICPWAVMGVVSATRHYPSSADRPSLSAMSHAMEADAFEPAWREGRRMLEVQERLHHAEFNRVAEMLRLAVAGLGGLILVIGLLATSGWTVPTPALAAIAVGVLALIMAIFLLTSILARPRRSGAFVYGADMGIVLDRLVRGRMDQLAVVVTLASAIPRCLESNERLIGVLERRKSQALGLLAFAAADILLALLYIAGGAILA